MAKEYSGSEIAERAFYISMAGIALFVAAVFIFVL